MAYNFGRLDCFWIDNIETHCGGNRRDVHNDYALPYSLLGMIIDKLRVSKSMREGLETALKNLKKLVEEEK